MNATCNQVGWHEETRQKQGKGRKNPKIGRATN